MTVKPRNSVTSASSDSVDGINSVFIKLLMERASSAEQDQPSYVSGLQLIQSSQVWPNPPSQSQSDQKAQSQPSQSAHFELDGPRLAQADQSTQIQTIQSAQSQPGQLPLPPTTPVRSNEPMQSQFDPAALAMASPLPQQASQAGQMQAARSNAGANCFTSVDASVTVTFLSAWTMNISASVPTVGVSLVSRASLVSPNTSSFVLPSWISKISTSSIAADIKSAAGDGIVGYNELVKLFNNLESSLVTTNSTLTSMQFADLTTITANLCNGLSTSCYLTNVTGSLVNGSSYNATWTGGKASSVSLGNLAAGSSATQLSELIGKWFLGTDLPSSSASIAGSNVSVSYTTTSGSLYDITGPNINDINQGRLSDCYFLSSLAEVADQNASLISSMITVNGNGTYGVRFYVNGAAQYVTVNSSLANGGTLFNHDDSTWASLIEKAYAQLGGLTSAPNSWTTIGNGGAVERALAAITGATEVTDYFASGSSWGKITYNSSLSLTGYSMSNSTQSVISAIVSNLDAGNSIVLSSYSNSLGSNGQINLVSNHAMSIYGYDSTTGLLQVRNPWGTASGQSWNTNFEVSLSTLLSAGDVITIANSAQSSTSSATTTVALGSTSAQALSFDATAANFAQAIASLSADGGVGSIVSGSTANPSSPVLASPLG
jgi:hypothetical protein